MSAEFEMAAQTLEMASNLSEAEVKAVVMAGSAVVGTFAIGVGAGLLRWAKSGEGKSSNNAAALKREQEKNDSIWSGHR